MAMKQRHRGDVSGATQTVVAVAIVIAGLVPVAANQGAMTAAVVKAGTADELTTAQGERMLAGVDARFIWVTVSATTARTFDLANVSFVHGGVLFPVVGVDHVSRGNPSRFSLIAPTAVEGQALRMAPAMPKSTGDVTFTFTPGSPPSAVLEVTAPPQSFCLAFLVPSAVRAGVVHGLGPGDFGVTLPMPADGWQPIDAVTIDGTPVPSVNVPGSPRSPAPR